MQAFFGVSLVPCIQTLGHMSQFLRWPSSDYLTDQKDVLLVDKSDDFINAMIEFCKKEILLCQRKFMLVWMRHLVLGFGKYYKKEWL